MFLWKPQPANAGKGTVFLAPDNTDKNKPPTITVGGQTYTGQYLNTLEGNHQFVFPAQLAQAQNLQLSYNGQTSTIANGGQSYEGDAINNWQARAKGSTSQFGGSSAGGMNLPNPNDINFNPIGYKGTRSAGYTFTDPLTAAGRYNDFNLNQENNAYNTGKARGTELTNLDTASTIDFAKQMSGLQQDLVASENKFNQAQKLQSVDFAMPDLRSSLDAKKNRADTYASGRLLTSAEDRAYQVAAQSASADGSFVRGFGDDSVFGKRTSDILSAQQRLGISQMGEGILNDWISQGSSLLIDSPLKTSISQRLPSVPSILPSQQAAQQQQELTSLSTVPLQFGISSEINQNQFKTNLDQNTNQFNASNQLATDQFNASGNFSESQAKFGAAQSNYTIALSAAQRAEDIQRQDAHDQAASAAADQNIDAQHTAGNTGAAGQIVGAIVGAASSALGGGVGKSATLSLPSGSQSLSTIAGDAPASISSSAPVTTQPLTRAGTIDQATQTLQTGFGGGTASVPNTTPSGAPLMYQGSAIPVASSSTDSGASASDIAAGYQATGSLVNNIGQAGPSTPQMSALGRGLSNGGSAADSITSTFQNVATPEARNQLVDQLHGAALSNASTAEDKASVDQIFSQVREHLDTGVGVNGQAAGIAGFVQNYDQYNGPEKARAITNISFAGQDLFSNYGVKDLSSKALGETPIPGTNNKMSIQDAMSLANSGYNVSSLVDNWDDIEGIHATLNPQGNVLSIASTARNLGLLSNETPDGVSKKQLALRQAGASPSGAWGAGAVSVPSSSTSIGRSLGMRVIGKTSDGQSILIPNASAASAGLSTGVIGSGSTAVAGIDQAPSTLAIGAGAARVYDTWSTDYIPKQRGNMGSSPAIANGLYALGDKDPFLLGNILLNHVHAGAVWGDD